MCILKGEYAGIASSPYQILNAFTFNKLSFLFYVLSVFYTNVSTTAHVFEILIEFAPTKTPDKMPEIPAPIDKGTLEKTASSLKAIAHPVRLAMINLLKDGKKMNVTQIYQALGLDQAVASQHLSILKEKEVFESSRLGKHSYYSLKNNDIVKAVNLLVASTYS